MSEFQESRDLLKTRSLGGFKRVGAGAREDSVGWCKLKESDRQSEVGV